MTVKPFFDQPINNKQGVYEKLVEIPRNDGYTTGNLLDYLYYQKYYKTIGKDLSRHASRSITQKINFVGKLEEDDGAKCFYRWKAKKKTIL